MYIKYILIVIILIIILLSIASCSTIAKKEFSKEDIELLKTQNPKLAKYIDRVYKMDKKSRRGLITMVGIKDKILSENTIKELKDNKVQGVILFKHNIENDKQLKKLTTDLKQKVNKNMIIAIDQEGGNVYRISWDKAVKIRAIDIGNSADTDYAYQTAYNRAKFLLDLGINTILGPVCDIATDTNSYIYERTFGTNVKRVSEMVVASVKGQNDAGIITALKHFPGHGDTDIDSHITFPTINTSVSELKKRDFIPFMKGIEAGADMVLIAHIKNNKIDRKLPSSLSSKHKDILVNTLGFKGVIITDDLAMTGKINKGISWGINLISDTYNNTKNIFNKIEPDILECAKILDLIDRKL